MMKTYKILISFFLILISSLGFSQPVPSYVPTNGLVGWWGFNGNAQDGSGNGNHGTVNGATLTTDRFGNQNGAYSFDGVNDFIQSTFLGVLNGTQRASFSFWFLSSGTNGSGIPIGHWVHNANPNGSIGIQIFCEYQTNRLGVCLLGGQCSSSNIINNLNGVWRHGLIRFDGSKPLVERISLFVDGVFVQNINVPNAPTNLGNLATRTYFGAAPGPLNGQLAAYNFFNGKLDDIGIWNRALTQLEITNLYYEQLGVNIPTINSCLGDTSLVTISHPTLTGVANASLRMTYNPDSLTYVGFNSLNPAFNGMTISGGNGVVLMNWGVATNQTIAVGNMVNLRFRVNGSSPITWDTLTSCEFSDQNLNLIPRTFVSGSITQNTKRFTWNRNICEGQSFSLSGQSYTTSGTYQGRFIGTSGACDTLITLNLNVLPRQTNPSVNVCSNQPYPFNGLQLNASGVYRDTLVNILGCDSIVQLNLTVSPAFNQNLAMTICAGGSLQFGSQNLTVAGNYTNTFVSSWGCDSLVNLSLNVSNSTTIVSSNGQNGFCPNGSVRIGLANPQSNAIYTWRKDGIIIPNANSDTFSVNQAGNYQLTLQVSPNCIIQSNILTIVVLNCNRITGDLRYDNANQTPLAGVPVHLKTLFGNIVASDTTDSSGYYDMAGYANGNYILDASVNYAWGGVTSADALLVTRVFNALISLSTLRLKAGDVNMNNSTNGSDALLINRRVTGVISSFGAGNFTNNLPSLNALGNPLVANLRILSTGDVNGSYAALPTTPIMVLDTVIAGFGSGTATVRFTSSGSGVFERGICWGTSPNPTMSANKFVFGGSGGYGFTQVFSGSFVGSQLQYARAYARTSSGIFYSNEKTFIPPPVQPCPGVSTVSDIDGNIYQGIQIGTQCWTQSNLKVSKYRNGDNIPTGLSNADWQNATSGAYAIYNNDPVNDALYGKLYNWHTVNDSRGLCPSGWHVPSDGEWTTLENHLGGSSVAGGALKSTAMQPTPSGWNSPNTGATNSSGFTALPGGTRSSFNGNFGSITTHGHWWSSSVSSGSNALSRILNSTSNGIFNNIIYLRTNGFSVRCIKNTLPQVNSTSVNNITSSSAFVTGVVSSDGGDQNTSRGFCYSTSSNPTVSNYYTVDGTGIGSYTRTLQNLTPSTTYYVRGYATNSEGNAYGNEVIFTTPLAPPQPCPGTPTVVDLDNNTYNTVQIGTQCWTQSNLKVSKYRNGDNIPTGLSNSAWQNTTSGAYAIYNNDPVNDGLYGKLYNFYAVTDSRGLCPTGWHLPSDGEWTTLQNLLGGSSVAGGALKSAAIQPTSRGWNTPNTGATNSSGFTALPSGERDGVGGFYGINTVGSLWSSGSVNSASGRSRHMTNTSSSFLLNNLVRAYGLSVRCLKD